MKLGIQMYSLYEDQDKDFEGTLKKVAEMGYDGIEFCGYCGREPKQIKKLLSDLGLEAASAHQGLPNKEDWAKVMDDAAEIGIPALIIPHRATEAWFPKCEMEKTFSLINEYGEFAKKYGIQIGFHNHYMEFCQVYGKTIMEQIYDNTPDDFIMQIDCCWAQYGYGDAFAAIKKFGKKSTILCHYKQLLQQNSTATTTIDKGCVDFKPITEYLKANNAKWAIVEQERIDIPALEAAKINHDYVRSIL